jgi:hypothetical protein
MPYKREYIEREVCLKHNGVTIYHAYRDDDADWPLTYWYALSPEDDADEFDVRDLPEEHHRVIIEDTLKLAIDAGLLKNPHGEAAR